MATANEPPDGTVERRTIRTPWNRDSQLIEAHVGPEEADGDYQHRSTVTDMSLVEGVDGLTVVDSGVRLSTTEVW